MKNLKAHIENSLSFDAWPKSIANSTAGVDVAQVLGVHEMAVHYNREKL
jgi:hypothetical protein